jgi:hypothetical protein
MKPDEPRKPSSGCLVAGLFLLVVYVAVEILAIRTLGSNSTATFQRPSTPAGNGR